MSSGKMQQPAGPDQANISNQQQLQQQMVLCPVRVVYETQILMPPGEQIQPNQTFFVNQQNQPPWANQNTQIYPQNQVLYVQQMPPNNIVPSAQPNIDQNQIQYIQQAYPTMQQVVANQNMLAQTMQDRQVLRQPVQYANMNLVGVNQYGQMINMQQMANLAPNMNNLIQSPINQNIQMVQNPTSSPKPQEMQQNINFLRSPMQQSQQGIIRQTVPPHQVMSRGVQQNVTNSHVQIQPTQMHNIQPKPNMVLQSNPMQLHQNIAHQANVQKQINIQPNVSTSHVQTQMNMGQIQQKPNITLQANAASNHVQTMPNLNQQSMQQRPANIQQQNHVQIQTSVHQNVQQRQNISVATSQVQTNINQNYTQRPHLPQTMTQYTQPNQSNRASPQTNFRPTYIPNQNSDQQRPNIGSSHAPPRSNIPQQYSKIVVRQPSPMDTTSHYNPTPNNIITVTNQTRPNSAKVGIPQQNTSTLHSTRVNPHNIVPQIRPRTAPMQNNAMKVAPSHQQVRNIPQLRPMGGHLMQMQNMASISPNVQSVPPRTTEIAQNNVRTASTSTESIGPTKITGTIDNRKRKSESPDEFRNKVSVNTATQVAFSKSVDNKTSGVQNCPTEVGINSTNSVSAINNSLKALSSPTVNVNKDKQETEPEKTDRMEVDQQHKNEIDIKSISAQEYVEKLVRNTVFAQARTRKMSNSSNDSKNVEQTHDQEMSNEETNSNPTVASKEEPMKANEIKKEVVIENVKEIKDKLDDNTPKSKDIDENKPVPVKNETSTEVKGDTRTDEEKIQRITDFIGKEIELSHGNIKKRDGNDSSYILTHVLDGIVIQESNVAFPIRLPLKEKILLNAKANLEVPKTEMKVEEVENKTSDAKILTISQLNIEGEIESKESDEKLNVCKEDVAKDEENIFSSSQPQTIKTWTVDELANHLSKNGWGETASILQENEIDGQALFLVSNSQLIDIGVNENHAIILSNFIKN